MSAAERLSDAYKISVQFAETLLHMAGGNAELVQWALGKALREGASGRAGLYIKQRMKELEEWQTLKL